MFRDRIKTAYDDLSPSFQRLADFLMDHPYEAAFMTATQLGRQLQVDTATVVRFAQRLEYPGFPELIDEVREEVRSQLLQYFRPPETAPSDHDAFRAALRQDISNIERFDLTLGSDTVERVISLINAARRIFVVGEGILSRPVANMLANALRALHYVAEPLLLDAATVATEFQTLSGQDLVIAVAVVHYCPDATSVLQVARERGANTIGFVGAPSWPIARAADVVVECPSDSPTKGASSTVFCAAVGALFQALFMARRSQVLEHYVNFDSTLHRLTEARGEFVITPPDWATNHTSQAD
jgi:DNA-binding MurR/RpiR family transcriptional regulator